MSQTSPDGMWRWDGQQWVPTEGVTPPGPTPGPKPGPGWKRPVVLIPLLVVGALFLLGALGALVGEDPGTGDAAAPAPTVTTATPTPELSESPSPVATEFATPSATVLRRAAWIKDQVGATEVVVVKDLMMVTIPISDNLTSSFIRAGFWRDAGNVVAVAQESDVKADNVQVIGTFPMQDNRGNELGDQAVMSATYMDFRGINAENVADWEAAADGTWVHPAMQ